MFEEPDGVDEPPLSETRPYLAVRGDLDDPAGTPEADTLPSLRPYLLTSGRAEPVAQTLHLPPALGALVIVDARGIDDGCGAVDECEKAGVPVVVAVNLCHGELPHELADVRW